MQASNDSKEAMKEDSIATKVYNTIDAQYNLPAGVEKAGNKLEQKDSLVVFDP